VKHVFDGLPNRLLLKNVGELAKRCPPDHSAPLIERGLIVPRINTRRARNEEKAVKVGSDPMMQTSSYAVYITCRHTRDVRTFLWRKLLEDLRLSSRVEFALGCQLARLRHHGRRQSIYSFSSAFRRAAPFRTLMLSCAARSMISLRLRAETLWATSAAYLRFCIRSTSSSLMLETMNL